MPSTLLLVLSAMRFQCWRVGSPPRLRLLLIVLLGLDNVFRQRKNIVDKKRPLLLRAHRCVLHHADQARPHQCDEQARKDEDPQAHVAWYIITEEELVFHVLPAEICKKAVIYHFEVKHVRSMPKTIQRPFLQCSMLCSSSLPLSRLQYLSIKV